MAEDKVFQSEQTDKVMKSVSYASAGADHELQGAISRLLHKIVMKEGTMTLAEMGYLHMNMVSYVEDHVEVKLYFLPALATRKIRNINGSGKDVPVDGLKVFQNYLFVGALEDAISYDTVTVPKYKLIINQAKNAELRIKDSKKYEEDEEVLVLHCNLQLTMAALHDVDLMTADYQVRYETVGQTNKKGNEQIMVIGTKREFPANITVIYEMKSSENQGGYNPNDAVPYLRSLFSQKIQTKDARRKLGLKVSEKAADMTQKQQQVRFKSFLNMR